MADTFSDAAAAALDKLTNLADKYGSEVTDAALLAVRVNGASSLVSGGLALAFAAGAAYAAYWFGKKASETRKDDPYGSGEVPLLAGAIVAGFVSVVAGLIGSTMLLNVWNWVAIVEPKLWIAKRLMGI